MHFIFNSNVLNTFTLLKGRKYLLQFKIEDPKYELINNGSELKARFTLQRNPEYMIINVYVPSFFTMIMTTLLLYLRAESHFSTAITLVLTSILCFFTLLQSSISHIPKTAYVKFIDYWNMLVLAITLANFFTLAIWELGDQNHPAIKWRQIKCWMRIVIPSITLLGVAVYFVIAVMLYI